MTGKKRAPKGKGRKTLPKTISPSRKIPLAPNKPKNTKTAMISLETALNVLQAHNIQITPETIDNLQALAKTPTTYIGTAGDQSRQTKRLMLQALERTLGIVTTAAKLAGIHRATHHSWMVADEEYRDAVHALSDVALDFAEEKLHEMIKDKQPAATIFYLKTKGKKRGYIETVHNMNQNFDDTNVTFYIPENDRDETIDTEAKVLTE